MTREELLAIRKEFRKYLRIQKGITGTDLDAIINAAEEHVPTLVREQFIHDFEGLYEDRLNLTELLSLTQRIERNDRVMAQRQGFSCQRAVEGYAYFFAYKNGLNPDDYRPQESTDYPAPDENLTFQEGSEYECRGMRYERDRNARSQCIEYYRNQDSGHKCRCQICGMCFEEVYGEIGKDVIEVHHIVPVSMRGGNYEVNPSRDLIPLCSNCHTMIHKGNMTIEELRRRFESQLHSNI